MEDNIIYKITVEDLQREAIESIGRELNDEEIDIAKDAFEWGLDETNHIICNTIFTEMIKK
ncbi:hypothetical protein FACS189413_19930 [Bacteroidia bacterium]|nr:hypothetical protein FACS189413_19930 [Bacteroidia bacterium]